VTAGRHPSDEDRARQALPVLEEVLRAAREGDGDALAACYDDDVVWLDEGGPLRGREAAARRHREIAAAATAWAPPQQQGAKAALRWTGPDGSRGAIVVEVRRGRIVFAATG
jgi:ketosteroid isomerase-like protein